MDRATATLPVIVCTGAISVVRDLEGHLREKGVTIVLKPFDIDELLTEVGIRLQESVAQGDNLAKA
jgi:DNA-binding response OmpR family regulator